MKFLIQKTALAVLTAGLALAHGPAFAQQHDNRITELEGQVAALAQQLAELSSELEATRQEQERGAAQITVAPTQSSSEWKDVTSVTHISGYASADYVSADGGSDAFLANFNPMFHFLYDDRILWEAELEVEIEEDGSTEIGLEYTTVDWFINDNLILVAGKFLSPIGNFRQNLHPSWINPLPSAPPGFGHDGAAPISDVGLQLRGVALVGSNSRITYAAYIGNGPKLEGEDGEIHAVEAEGLASDPDDEKVFGGRVAYLPFPQLEVAISAATGDVAVVEDDGTEITGDPGRGYDVLGFDAAYQIGGFELRGEYIRQEVDAQPLSVAPEGGKWDTWYLQGSYTLGDGRWEGVARYTDFQSPHADDTQEQWAFGLNYLIAPSALLKFGYEFNDGLAGEPTDADRWILQIAYGY